MSEQYQQMWAELGLDLEAHDALLATLGQVYQDIYLAQPNRPKAMEYFDFVMSEVHGLRIKELIDAKNQGRKVIGSFCVFVPEEIILAVDGISVGLCAGAEFGFDLAEKVLPRNTCSLIKSAFGFKLGKVCPYIESCDVVVGENTCDGKKKAYEIFQDMVDDLYILDLPQSKTDQGRRLLREEYRGFIGKMEAVSGKTITVENLQKAIETVNQKRQALARLRSLRSANPVPISGLDALLINQISFYDDPVRFTASVNKLCDELEQRVAHKEGVFPADTPRILMSGCPMAVPNWKLPSIVESTGAVIVGEESCVGERGTRGLVDSRGGGMEEMLDNIVERYLQIDCAIFTPNPERRNNIDSMTSMYKADGILHYSLQFCQPYSIESGLIENQMEDNGIPVLRIETDYSMEDVGQLKTRVEAFMERISQ
ncbi:MAG: 2-hydroxyacyl-CoA dehydratase [candidate division Zixibacteria bacterium]|nr:2-hydroxyacyl-CoA dehydratase [candidate division Zixibacteria bacterium]